MPEKTYELSMLYTKVPIELLKKIATNVMAQFSLKVTDPINFKIPDNIKPNLSQQYDASQLIHYIKDKMKTRAIWVIPYDLTLPNRNFVFGSALYYNCCVLSTSRLNELEIYKEAIHEVGHVLGLKHCNLPCIMALSKVATQISLKHQLCDRCKEELKSHKINDTGQV